MKIGRVVGVLIAALMLTAASEPPPELARYFHGEAFDPGDFGWMRGGFAGATPAEARTYAAVNAWLTACFEEGKAHTRDELAAMGVQHADLATIPPRDLRCDVVATAQSATRERSATWAEFQQNVAEARPFATSFLLALRLAEEMAMPHAAASLEQRILARTIGEQVLRKATDWGEGEMADAPRLSDGARAVLIAQLSVAMGERDFANTAWLKAEVAKDGWPTIARAGETGSMMAWLLVQHADADPAFQLRALRLMAPLAARGEVNKRNYAYLYDRVMLKISGKQRYATQVTCTAGKRVPLPLEDAAKMPALRSEAGLEPLADYIKSFEGFSPCPKAS